VSLKQPRSGESFAAYFTHAWQSVSPDVHFKSSEADVLLLAVLATERFPRLSVAVQLFVLEQSGIRRVRLGAQAALELLRLHAVGIRELGEDRVVLVACARAFRAAVVFGRGVRKRRRVSGDRRQVTGKGRQRQVVGGPHGDGAVRSRAEDLRLWHDRQGKGPIDVR